ncbi:hypothetical protein [Burkholderia ubonensis]|uniref:hypothetical protein n=1 Tax=Burkholderia ubonensis TaxID=101571 RepID=UPI000F569CF9|nr:hypothetical protein [Burkholderia ubonensis]
MTICDEYGQLCYENFELIGIVSRPIEIIPTCFHSLFSTPDPKGRTVSRNEGAPIPAASLDGDTVRYVERVETADRSGDAQRPAGGGAEDMGGGASPC